MKVYNHREIEKKWQSKWDAANLYRTTEDADKPKYYVLDMFPYPSGVGLHVGHPKGYIATDIIARMKRMQGYNVLHPMGWDAFGLPAENYAIKNKVHPRDAVKKNIATFKDQIRQLGLTYDWSREIDTTDPNYYKWTQWIFLKMFEKGLAYESYEPIIWCPGCKTGLANEDLEDGKCERCGSEIERKPMRQWVLKITDYADRMLEDLDKLPGWEESIKTMQRNWIGRSEGSSVTFTVHFESSREETILKVFTTRPDTLFGATYMVVAPEHDLIEQFQESITNYEQVQDYAKQARKKSDLQRTDLNKDKSGIRLEGVYAVNPVNKKKIPVFVADYVLAGYGTGAIMAVPAHDERDFEFAKKYNLPVLQVVAPWFMIQIDCVTALIEEREIRSLEKDEYIVSVKNHHLLVSGSSMELLERWLQKNRLGASYKIVEGGQYFQETDGGDNVVLPFCDKGISINSEYLSGKTTEEAQSEILVWLEKKGLGGKEVIYKLQDWVFSRQRYWGEPIPIIHCEVCGSVPVPENELPLRLPDVENYEPTGTEESPLANIEEWVNTTCPRCGGVAKRETNTMPQWAGSSWYYLRYIDPNNSECLVDKEKEKYWSPVDQYVGGAEHATRHLIYARFWHKFLYDIEVVNYEEPFTKVQQVGMILAEDGRKMGKRWGNAVNPNDVVTEYGADAMRVYEMFMGPFNHTASWSTRGLAGVRRFLGRVWHLRSRVASGKKDSIIESALHETVKKVGEDITDFKFNTAVSQMMILVNAMTDEKSITEEQYKMLLTILAPFAPYLSEELWSELGGEFSIHNQPWPEYDESLLVKNTIEIAVQVNGKVRGTVSVAIDEAEESVRKKSLDVENVKNHLQDKEVVKFIYIHGRIVNIVVK